MLRRRVIYPLAVVAMLGAMAFAMVTTAVQQTPTIDEPVYVVAGEIYRQQHDLSYNPEHPPLAKLIMAVGQAFDDAHLDTTYQGEQNTVGRHLLYESGNNPFRLMLAARLSMIVLTLAFGLVVLGFARDIAGPWGGLLALALYSFSPDVIAHGSLATLDVPAAGLLLTTFWMLWRARARPRLYLPLAGVALGAAVATRMSALPAIPVVFVLVVWPFLRTNPKRTNPKKWWVGLAVAVGVEAIAVAVVWLVYLAVDPHLRFTMPANTYHPGGLRELAVDLLPFPQAYRYGMLFQFKLETATFNGFLLGHAYRGSPWYYLPIALLIKMPLGMLALWVAGTVTMLVQPRLRAAAPYLLGPAAVLLLVAMKGTRDYGTRYAIFMPIFLAVVAGTVVLIEVRWIKVSAAVLTLFVAVSSARTFPYYLPYSNEAFGGPSKTHLNLHDSNADWGQDLGRLAVRLRERYPGQPVWLIYKGVGVPAYYGINGRNPYAVPPDEVHGLLVVSDSRVALASARLRQLLDVSTPIDEVGHTITIYRR